MDGSLVYYPDPRLRDTAHPIGEITDEIRAIVPRMFEVMRAARGIGLAGPQIGFSHRIVVASILYDPEKGPEQEVYINPKIADRTPPVRDEEGCLSLPGLVAQIERAQTVTAEYLTLEGERRSVEVSDLHARLFQHEIDHLDGILIIDRMSPAEKKHWAPLLKELEEDFATDRRREQKSHSEAAL